ncbi:YdcF family protein [Lusitaniella coriacea LEGE 07157]|uniref:YdcF family protein n=1 Tax=Lusitaniella coriacea LEGE 07157 TaxID=945747 RepID=A0A8J7IXS1_9CYAN|nr:ElyC/SanA/YdcF family protein [Lusitaniella coriacea]MBE9118952.1 YdcF family protein [Lusitaniella coriacea LEGE 07157]
MNPRHWLRWKLVERFLLFLFGILLGCLLFLGIRLQAAASKPVDAFFVLGGSIRREMYVAEQIAKTPKIPVLISHGSLDPCIWLIFQREQASMQKVWLEHCANSTFENFYFGVPILKRWKVHKVKLITSATHLPRAKWMAQILFGAQGIWVEMDIAKETGVPANQESAIKTSLDVVRSLGWAIAGQFIQPDCTDIIPLAEVDMATWRKTGFKCEHQGNLDDSE